MDRSEPALIPEWLKSSGSATSGGFGNHQSASCLHSDDHSVSKHARNKSSFVNSEHDGGRSFVSERTTSSYFRRSASGKDSSHSRSYSSFSRSHRDREWEDTHDFRDKDRSVLGEHRHREFSDHMGGVLPGKFTKESLRRSQSMISRKLEGSFPKKVAGDSGDVLNSNHHIKSSSLSLASGSVTSSMQTSFVRDFPSLGADQKQGSELRRVPSPVLPSAVHSLPSSGPKVVGADGWTSSLAEVPGVIASSSTASLPSQQAVSGSSAPLAQRAGGLNMAEAVAQGPARARTPPQVSVDTQRLEELAIKQSRQLIPVIPSTPKPVLLGPSDKSKPKTGQQQAHVTPSHGNQSLRGGPVRIDSGKVSSNLGKLQVLKPARELNGLSSTVVKENLSPKNGVKVVNTPLSLNPTAVTASAPLRIPANIQISVGPDRKSGAVAVNLEKRPSAVQGQSRSDFFNLLKKKSSSSASHVPAGNEAVPSALDKSLDSIAEDSTAAAATTGDADFMTSESKLDGSSQLPSENGGKVMANGEGDEGFHYLVGNGEDQVDAVVPYPDEEEAAFLRSLGWDEKMAGEDEGLTEDEIHAFYEYMKKKARPEPIGVQLKVNNNNGSCVGSPTGLNLSKS